MGNKILEVYVTREGRKELSMCQLPVTVIFTSKLKSWAGAMELLSQNKNNENFQLIDGTCLQIAFGISHKRKKFQRDLLSNARTKNITKYARNRNMSISRMLEIVSLYRHGLASCVFPQIVYRDFDLTDIVKCRLASRLGSRKFDFKDVRFIDFYKFAELTIKTIDFALEALEPNGGTIFLYNGREPIEASFAVVAKSYNYKIVFIERGSSNNSFEYFQISPHYHPEWWKKIQDYSKLELTSNQRARSEEFISNKLQGIDSYKDEVWNAGYSEIDTSGFGNYALFLSSSSTEYSPIKENNYECGFSKNQFYAAKVLAEVLLENDLRLVVRRHPNSVGYDWKDREEQHWSEVMNMPNVVYFSPKEKVSTYSILKGARIVYVWKSSTGFESLVLGKRTFCLASAKWSWNSIYQLNSREDIANSIASEQDEEIRQKTISQYANFMANSGITSSLFADIGKHYVLTNSGIRIPNFVFQRAANRVEELYFNKIKRYRKRNA